MLWIKLIQSGNKIANIPDMILRMRTGEDFITRRGWRFLKGELRIYRYMYSTNFINLFEFSYIVITRSVLRLSPTFVKVLLYKMAR